MDFAEIRAKHFRRTTPENDDFRLEKVDGVAEPDGEILQRLFEDFFRKRIVGVRCFSDHFAADCGCVATCQLQ